MNFSKLTKKIIVINIFAWFNMTLKTKKITNTIKNNNEFDNGKIAILISPWFGTSIPIFTIIVSLLLKHKGFTPVYFFDDISIFDRRDKYTLFFLKNIVNFLQKKNKVIFVSKLKDSKLKNNQEIEFSKLIDQNSIWYSRGEQNKKLLKKNQRLIKSQFSSLQMKLNFLKDNFCNSNFKFAFIPGGAWGCSGLWMRFFKSENIRVSTFDSGGYKTTMLCSNGIACKLQDISIAHKMILDESSDDELKFIIESSKNEMNMRAKGKDKFHSQIQGIQVEDYSFANESILIPLNSSWDGAALGIHEIFENNNDWLISTIDYLIKNTNKKIIIRQHPAERLDIARTSDNYKGYLFNHFQDHERVIFISAQDKVNSYELLKKCSFVVVASTTFGIEAATKGKIVLTAANCYLNSFNFIVSCNNKDQYFKKLKEFSNSKINKIEQKAIDEAYICFFLTQICNWVFADIYPENVNSWINSFDIHNILDDKNTSNLIDSIIYDIPVSYLNYKTIYKNV